MLFLIENPIVSVWYYHMPFLYALVSLGLMIVTPSLTDRPNGNLLFYNTSGLTIEIEIPACPSKWNATYN